MNECNWEVIDGFSSPYEYERFIIWIDDQVKNGTVVQVPVMESYAGSAFEEKWFKCLSSSDIWRLVAPQAPFLGYNGDRYRW
jgi:hypothetical protein